MTNQCIDNGKGVYTQVVAGRIQVKCPYHKDFVVFAHQKDGRWRHRSGIWSFRIYQFPEIAVKLNQLYGTHISFRGHHE